MTDRVGYKKKISIEQNRDRPVRQLKKLFDVVKLEINVYSNMMLKEINVWCVLEGRHTCLNFKLSSTL